MTFAREMWAGIKSILQKGMNIPFVARIYNWYRSRKRWVRISLPIPIATFFLCFFFYLLILIGVFGPVPNQRDFLNLEKSQSSQVIGANGEMIGKFFAINRTYVKLDTLPKHLITALIDVEDKRFYRHGGIDWRGSGRAIFKTLLMGKESGGGSTISQQLVKNVFGRKKRLGSFSIYLNKIKEMIGARRLERLYGKDKIVELYLNTVPFGENVYGIEAAAERYYSKHASELTIGESSALVGMLKANTYYSPRLYPERCKERRSVVLALMQNSGHLALEQVDSIEKHEFKIDYNRKEASQVEPHYLRQIAAEASRLLDGETKHNGDPYDLKRDGLVIRTSIHPKMQQYAEEAMQNHMVFLQRKLEGNWGRVRPWGRNPDVLERAVASSPRFRGLKARNATQAEIDRVFATKVTTDLYYPKGSATFPCRPIDSVKHTLFQLRAGFVAIDNLTGSVLCWVGSPNYQHFEYDYVTSKRQVASTFKPIVYATALEEGFKPCDFFRNEQVTYTDYDDWSPENFNGKYGGKYSMKGALAQSVNVVAVKLLYEAKRHNVIELAQNLGIESEIPALPSIALGVADISLVEMVNAYSVFANEGIRRKLHFITQIEDRNGRVLFKADDPDEERVMDDDNAIMLRHMMQGVVENGTGRRLRSEFKLAQELAGKTGTAQSYSDGWFIGFSPSITAGAWVGGENPSIRFRSGTYGQGSRMALPIFGGFMQRLENDTSLSSYTKDSFPPLSSELERKLDCQDFRPDSGLDKVIDAFRDKTLSDDKIGKRNKRRKIFRKIIGK